MARDAVSYTPGLRRGWERGPVSHSNEGAAEPQAQMQAEGGTRGRGMRGVPWFSVFSVRTGSAESRRERERNAEERSLSRFARERRPRPEPATRAAQARSFSRALCSYSGRKAGVARMGFLQAAAPRGAIKQATSLEPLWWRNPSRIKREGASGDPGGVSKHWTGDSAGYCAGLRVESKRAAEDRASLSPGARDLRGWGGRAGKEKV